MKLLNVRIISPKQIIFHGEALVISSINSAGKFDILPEHANFITVIENQDLKVRTPDKKMQTFHFPIAIIYTSQNQVRIYTDIIL